MDTALVDGYPAPAPQYLATGLLAPYFAGWGAQLLFSGITISSFYSYLTGNQFSRDSRRQRGFTFLLMALNAGTTIMNTRELVYWGTTQDRSVDHLYSFTLLDCFGPLPVIMISTIVQAFYVRRTARLFRSQARMWIFVAAIGFLMFFSALGAILTIINQVTYFYGNETYLGVFNYYVTSDVWLWTGAAIDCGISATLMFLLRTRVAGFNKTTDSFLVNLMKLAIHSAAYTAIVSFVGAIVSMFISNTEVTVMSDVPAAFWMPLPSLYACSYFTTISSQDRIVKELQRTLMTSGGMSLPRVPTHLAASRADVNGIVVKVEIDVDEDLRSERDQEEEQKNSKRSGGRISQVWDTV